MKSICVGKCALKKNVDPDNSIGRYLMFNGGARHSTLSIQHQTFIS